jgi:hypothetical protein
MRVIVPSELCRQSKLQGVSAKRRLKNGVWHRRPTIDGVAGARPPKVRSIKSLRQRHLIDNQIAALFNVMDFNPQILT